MLQAIAKVHEDMHRNCREYDFPQYTYVSVPVYKACVGKVGEVAATAVSFFVTDLVAHQVAPQVYRCLAANQETCSFSYSFFALATTAVFAAPVMYAKYKR